MSKRLSETEKLSDALSYEMREYLQMAMGPRCYGDTTESALVRAARALGMSPQRARGHWYRTARQILACEMDAARAWAAEYKVRKAEQLRHELALLEAQSIAFGEAAHGMALARVNSDLACAAVQKSRHAVDAQGAMVGRGGSGVADLERAIVAAGDK